MTYTAVIHRDAATVYLEQAAQAWREVESEWEADQANSGRCRLATARAGHYRRMAEVHALLAQVPDPVTTEVHITGRLGA